MAFEAFNELTGARQSAESAENFLAFLVGEKRRPKVCGWFFVVFCWFMFFCFGDF